MVITAEDIDNTKKQLAQNVEEAVIKYIKGRLAKIVRELKLRMQTENPNYIFSKEEKDRIKSEIINDEETKAYREYQFEVQKTKSENYFVVRDTLQGMNELNEFSSDIERCQIQTIDNFKRFKDLIKLNITLQERFLKYKQIRKDNIQKYIETYKNKQLSFSENDIALCAMLSELYTITKDYDDIDLYDKFEMQSNIDISNKLGDYYLMQYVNGNTSNNIINNWYSDSESKNIFDKLIHHNIISNKFLGLLLLSTNNRTSFISNNQVTCYQSMYTTTKNNKHTYVIRTLGELLFEITNPKNSILTKTERQQIYMTYDGTRPSSEEYYKWNGLQVFDIDLKEWEQCNPGMIELLKKKIFEYLNDFHWFLWIAKSASGKGIHIYTKVTPPHHVYTDITDNEYISKYWFQVNYTHKSSVIYDVLRKIHLDNSNNIRFKDTDFLDNFELKFLDNVVSRITAGIRLTYDNNILINHDFLDLHVGIGLSDAIQGTNIFDLFCRDTTIQNKLLNLVDNELCVKEINQEKIDSSEIDLSKYEFGGELTQIQPLPRNSINYNIRYNVCNTLAALFGKEGLPIAHTLLQSELCKNVKEINAFYTCAISNKKEPTKLGIDILKKAGIIKQVKSDVKEYVDNKYKNHIRRLIENALDNNFDKPILELKDNEYLGDRMDYLIKSFTNSKINILLSPAGSGKCLGKDTPILMYDGSIKMVQDVKVGDQLMGWDSKPRNVLSTCTGKEMLYQIIPNKGMPWVCNESHILSVIYTGKWKNYQNGNIPNPLDIEDINIKRLYNWKGKHERKLFRVPLNFPKQEVLITPYILGLWLGDGTSTEPEITVAGSDREIQYPLLKYYAQKLNMEITERFSHTDNVSVFRINKPENIRHNPNYANKFTKLLEYYNLIGNKHIPKEYLLNDRKTRLFLFAGIIDSDGGGSDGTYDIVTKFDSFKDDLVWLSRSLGYYVLFTKKLVKTLNGKEINKEYWRIQISGDFSDVPIRLKRKKFVRKINKNPLVTGFNIKQIGIGDYYGFEIDGDKRFMLGDFTVTHNTQFLIRLAKEGKRILLVEPYISVIKNKVETDKELMKIFQVFYGDNQLKNLEPHINAISTIDKLARSNYEKLARTFDYICIDESHLLFTSSYRIEATSNAVRKIKELQYIANNDPFAAKIILMTGTETGETFFFNENISNVITVSKKSHDKKMEFLICDDNLDAITRMAHKTYLLIKDGYRVIIPTNKGEIYSHKLISMVSYLLGREPKFGYYKRSNIEQEICRLINEDNTVGDYEIIFCSNYLGVGIDIIDKLKFVSIYYGQFSGYEIEQFNARIRKIGIRSVYCIQTELNDGSTNDMLIEEPALSLKLTDEDIEQFTEDKEIAKAKTEFIAEYDPVLHKIITPGFSYINGAIRFDKENYELTMFETKYNLAMMHPVKIARELSKYGYEISVSNEYDGLPETTQEELKRIGIEGARQEKLRKHSLLVGTYLSLIENNYYKSPEGLEFTDIISWIGKHRDLIIEDREMEDFLKIEYNIFAQPTHVFVKSQEAFENMYAPAKYLISKYSVEKAKNIILQYVDDNGILKQKHFKRAMNLLKLIEKSDNNMLSEPVFNTITKIYDWLDKFAASKNYRISYNSYQADLDSWTNSYINDLGINITTTYGFQKIRDSILEMLNDIATKNTSKDGVRFDYNKLPDEDGAIARYRKSVDNMIESMFSISTELISKNKSPRSKHILLTSQEF